jgi:hypothetical protein
MAATAPPKEISPVALLLLAALLYIFYTEPSEKALLVAIAAVAAWVTLKSCNAGFAVIAAFYILKLYNAAADVSAAPAEQALKRGPVAPLSGYPKDPASVQARIEAVKGGAPLQPKVETITGVLESPTILDAAPLQPLDKLASEALPGATIPASAKARVAIYAPPEDTVAKDASSEKAPLANPYLQAGPDDEGTLTALIPKGTDLPSIENIGSQIAGALSGAGLAF